GQAEGPPLAPLAVAHLPSAGVEHRCAPAGQHGQGPLRPICLQGGEQALGPGALQHAPDLSHRHLHPFTAALSQQASQLGIGQGHMGAHHHQAAPGQTTGGPATQGGQRAWSLGLGGQGGQAIEQAGGRLKE
ncbi:MAG: hypothetical protein ACK55I_24945, partial [bacterium]